MLCIKCLRWFLLSAFFFVSGVNAEVFVIVNKENSLDAISQAQLVRIFMKKSKRFENSIEAVPVAQKKGNKVRAEFNTHLLGKSEQQLKYYWSRKMFSGDVKPPKSFKSDKEVEKYVSHNMSAIGYVSHIKDGADVKIIKVIP